MSFHTSLVKPKTLKLIFPASLLNIGGVMASVLASSSVDHGCGHQSAKTEDCKIGISCSARHVALRSKNRVNVSE